MHGELHLHCLSQPGRAALKAPPPSGTPLPRPSSFLPNTRFTNTTPHTPTHDPHARDANRPALPHAHLRPRRPGLAPRPSARPSLLSRDATARGKTVRLLTQSDAAHSHQPQPGTAARLLLAFPTTSAPLPRSLPALHVAFCCLAEHISGTLFSLPPSPLLSRPQTRVSHSIPCLWLSPL